MDAQNPTQPSQQASTPVASPPVEAAPKSDVAVAPPDQDKPVQDVKPAKAQIAKPAIKQDVETHSPVLAITTSVIVIVILATLAYLAYTKSK